MTNREQAILASLIEAMIEPGTHVPRVDHDALPQTQAAIQLHLPPYLQRLYSLALWLLELYSFLTAGRAFQSGDLPERRALLAGLYRRRLGRRLVHLLGIPIKFVHFSREAYLSSYRIEACEPIPAASTDRALPRHHPAQKMSLLEEVDCDVVIVGSGAGGAPVASYLAQEGYAVAIVEEGDFYQRQDFRGNPLHRKTKLWRDKGFSTTIGRPPIFVPVGKMVGGTTAINSGTCVRPPPEVLQRWVDDLGFSPELAPEQLEPYVELVEQTLQVCAADSKHLGPSSAVIARGADALGLVHGPLMRNTPGCDGQGQCIFGCPAGAKRSTNESYIQHAIKHGAHLFTGYDAQRLVQRGARVSSIEAVAACVGAPAKRLRIAARAIVLSCGTFHTPTLLLRNGIRLPWLGRNLSCHPAMGMYAMLRDLSTPWRTIPQGYGFADPAEPGITYEEFYVPPQLCASVMPLINSELCHWMDNLDRMIQVGFFIKDTSAGSVRPGPRGKPLAFYNLSRKDLSLLKQGASLLAKVLVLGGAEEVLTGIGVQGAVRTASQAEALRRADLRPGDFSLMGFHPLGTCRMGPDAASSVVGFNHQIHGLENVFVSDGSVVPAALGVNPQVTIMALAERAGRKIAQHLG